MRMLVGSLGHGKQLVMLPLVKGMMQSQLQLNLGSSEGMVKSLPHLLRQLLLLVAHGMRSQQQQMKMRGQVEQCCIAS